MASGGFWDRLGMTGDLPAHLPIGVTKSGQGPATNPHHWVCWCPDDECPLTLALEVQRKTTLANIHIHTNGRATDD